MKKLALLSIMVAFIFGYNVTPVQAGENGIENEEVTNGGLVNAFLNEATESIALRMSSGQKQERVLIVLTSNATGKSVYEEKTTISNQGIIMEIPMASLKAGMYTLRVNGQTVDFSKRFKKK